MIWKQFFSKKNLILALIGSSFWLVFILRFGSYHLTLDKGWADSVSHMYTSWLFWDHGLDVLKRPIQNFVQTPTEDEVNRAHEKTGLQKDAFHKYVSPSEESRTVFIVWPTVPRPYPPGLYLYTSPSSALLYHGFLELRTTLALNVWLWLFLAHLSALFFYAKCFEYIQTESIYKKIIPGLLSLIAYFEFIRWTLNAQYDILAVSLLIVAAASYRAYRLYTALFLLSLAAFMHLRAIYLLPLGVMLLYRLFVYHRDRGGLKSISIREIAVIFTSLVLVGFSALTLFWNTPYFKIADLYDLNALHWSKISLHNVNALWLFAGLIALTVYWARNRQWALISFSIWVSLLFMQSRLMREWYVLFLFPIVYYAIDRAKGRQGLILAALIFYTLFASVFLSNSPFEFRIFRSIVEIFS